jgi:hypothetical protein
MYSVDASAVLDGWVRHYPPDVFPSVWQQLATLVRSGRVFLIDEVHAELKRKDDGAAAWFGEFPHCVVPIDEDIQASVRRILEAHPRLLDTRKNKSGADPFVIALGQVRGFSVVTGEQATNSMERPKIPDVCGRLGIPCLTLLEMFRAERLTW